VSLSTKYIIIFSILQLFDDPSAKKINIKGLTRQLFATKTVLG
jgi:hypothetical protein